MKNSLFVEGTIVPLDRQQISDEVRTLTLREVVGPELKNTNESVRFLYHLTGDDGNLLYRLLAFGGHDFRIPGFLDYPSAPRSSVHMTFVDANNPQRIITLVKEGIAKIQHQSKGIETPNTVLLPQYFSSLEDSLFPHAMAESNITARFLPELSASGERGEGSVILYNCDRRKVKATIFKTPSGRVKSGGTVLYRPMSMHIISLSFAL